LAPRPHMCRSPLPIAPRGVVRPVRVVRFARWIGRVSGDALLLEPAHRQRAQRLSHFRCLRLGLRLGVAGRLRLAYLANTGLTVTTQAVISARSGRPAPGPLALAHEAAQHDQRQTVGVLGLLDGLNDADIGEAGAGEVGGQLVRVRMKYVAAGLEAAIYRKPPAGQYRRRLDGEQEARLVALTCSAPPEGHKRWTLRLLVERLVELEVVDAISHETVRQALKQTVSSRG
jgi:Homeodomain-like domain